MHFSKFMTVSQIQTNTRLISEQLTKSPIRPPNPKIDKTDQNHPIHLRTKSSFLSPPTHPSSYSPLTAQKKQYRTKSPANNSPMLPNSRQEKQNYEYFNMRNRKRSENPLLNEGEQHMIKSMVFTKPAPALQNPHFRRQDKERKASCNLELVAFGKKTEVRNADYEQCPEIRSKGEPRNALLRKKKLGWDENNNFQLDNSLSCSTLEVPKTMDMTRSVVDLPKRSRINNLRQHPDNDNLKKVPSFIAQSKNHRKSFHVPTQAKGIDIQSFLIVRELGKGAFGRVVLAVEKESKIVCAIKIMSKRDIREDNMVEQLTRELKIQTHINHPNIVKVYGFFTDLLHFYIIMECALDGHLSDYMQKSMHPLPEAEAASMFAQICSAVSLLHSTSIIHRDLKPENVMIHEGIVKICDFGWSVHRGGSLRTTFCGTPIYLCPEILVGDEYDDSIDIWALGVILYEMLFKSNPFRITCKQELVNILNEPIHFDQSLPVSSCAKDIITMCLNKRAVDRPNIRELQLHQFLIKLQLEQLKR